MSKRIFHAHVEQIRNNKDDSAIERFIAPNYRGIEAGNPEIISGTEGYKQHFVTLTTAFPDLQLTIEDIMEEADRVAARYLAEGTHTGNFGDIPPTGKRVRVTGTAIVRFSNSRIVEEHVNNDSLSLLKQIGVIPETVKVAPLVF